MFRIKLLYKMFLALMTVVLGLMMTVFLIVNYETTKAVELKLERDIGAAREVFENFNALGFERQLTFNHTVAEVPYLKEILTTPNLGSEIAQRRVSKVRDQTDGDLLMVFDKNRTVIATAQSFEKGKGVLIASDVFKTILKGLDYQGIYPQEDKLLQLVGSPFKVDDEVVGGLLTGHLVDSSTIKMLQKMTNMKVVIFGENKVIADESETLFFRDLLSHLGDSAKKNSIYIQKLVLDGKEFWVSLSNLPNSSGFFYGLVRELSEELIFYQDMRQRLIVAAAIITLGALLLGLFFARRVVRPIYELVKAVENVAEGRFDHKVPVVTHDEVGVLAENFNLMTENLEESRYELVSAKENMQNIIRSMQELLIVVHPDFTIRMVNEATCKLLKISQEKLVGTSFLKLFSGKPFEAIGGTEGLLTRGRVMNVEEELKAVDGGIILVSLSASILYDRRRRLSGIVFVLQDIRKRKQLESIAIQSEKMAAVGKLAGGLSHEISSPIGTILGHSELVLKRFGGKLEPRLLKSIEVILKEATRCKNIVENLLTFSRLKSPEMHLNNVNDLLKSTIALFASKAHLKRVRVSTFFDEHVPGIMLNETQIQQAVLNLCLNAIDALPEQGHLTLKTYMGERDSKRWVFIEVIDNGAGIPQDKVQSLFEPFYTTKEVGKGTGLGLYLVYEIITNHGGTIHVESEIEQGTKFTISLPMVSVIQQKKGA